MNKPQQIVITRGMVGSIASLIGFGSLIAGIVAWIGQGALTSLVLVLLAIGAFGIASWAALQPADFRGFVTGRGVRFGTSTMLNAALLIGIIALTYVLTTRAALTWDLTAAQRFTLSNTTLEVLQRVTRPIQITGFYSSQSLNLRETDDQFFRLYEAATDGLIRRVYYDPLEVPAIAERFNASIDGLVYVSYLNSDGSVDFSSLSVVPLTGTQERDMTQAISRLLFSGTLTVYFDIGLGERDPRSAEADGISSINNGVREFGLITYPLDLPDIASRGGDIPRDASAVIMARPLRDLTPDEIGVIDRYLGTGGSLLLLADVLFNEDLFLDENGAFNLYLWETFGIRALNRAVVDPVDSGFTPLDVIGAVLFEGTDLAVNLDPAENPTLFRLARAVDVNLDSAPQDIANGRLIMSSDQSFGETDWVSLGQTNTYRYDQGRDVPGSQTLVVWSWNQATNARIMLVGDSDFVTNGQVLLGGAEGNAILFLNAISWLTRLGDQIQFAPQQFGVSTPVFVDAPTLNFIRFSVVILLPGLVLLIGAAIYVRRVRR
jgi:hypothetical protein